MSSSTEICNLALSHLGVGKPIDNLETEKSQEAAVCRRFYQTARQAVLRDMRWPFAKRIEALGLVEEDPNEEWDYSYRYPVNCLLARRILSGTRNDTQDTQIPFVIASDDSGELIYTDEYQAELEYTFNVTNEALFPPDFVLAFSFRLAAYIAPTITAGDPFKMGARALQMYGLEIYKASSNAFNEQKLDRIVESEFVRARE